ncbi:MAG: IS4 family transposase [Proteobacteria bacterium]|nr:IS4 family transposase [Pseudomonadota bacterium]
MQILYPRQTQTKNLLVQKNQQLPMHQKKTIQATRHIDLCLTMFPWAKFRRTKGAIKLHVGIDHQGFLPMFLTVTDGKKHDVTQARALTLPTGSIVAVDRGYIDYQWFDQLNRSEIYFVTRAKKNMRYAVRDRKPVVRGQGISSDQSIVLTSLRGQSYPKRLRRVGYKDPQTGKHYFFLTNNYPGTGGNFTLAAKTIADIYKARWQIELFFKWIKQNLKVKSFLGTSKNAVMTQIWVAMCMYLMLSYLKFSNRLGWSLQQILRVLQLNLFERRPLLALFTTQSQPPDPPMLQLRLAGT